MQRAALIGFLMLATACDGSNPGVVSGAPAFCDPISLDGCAKVGEEGALVDLYTYCADPTTAADDPLCLEPVSELGVTSSELRTSWLAEPNCQNVLKNDMTMQELQNAWSVCLSQDTHESDSWKPPAPVDVRQIDEDPTGSGGGDGKGDDGNHTFANGSSTSMSATQATR